MPTSTLLSPEDKARVLNALRTALPEGPETMLVEDKVLQRGDGLVVPVAPTDYPEDKWAFLSGVSAAEIALRDAGLKVRLQSVVAQRMLVVAKAKGRGAFAYLTTDGAEYRDLAALLGVEEGALGRVDIEGYAYDTDADLTQVLTEARNEYPDVDFSPIRPHHTASSAS